MTKMYSNKLRKYVCCTLDVTIGARIISFIGIMISVLLITILLNDKYFDTRKDNYDMSRKVALALGLDWTHFHSTASAAHHNDPEGRMISIIVIFYSSAFLLINLILCYATIKGDCWCAVPWLACEFIGCSSKLGALIYHFYYDSNNLSTLFIIGSILYIVTMVWWWMVVFLAQISWRRSKSESIESLELSDTSSFLKSQDDEIVESVHGKIRIFQDPVKDIENIYSPAPYTPNFMFTFI